MLYLVYTYIVQKEHNLILKATTIEAENVHEALLKSKKDIFDAFSIPETIWNSFPDGQKKAFLKSNCLKVANLQFTCKNFYKFSLNIFPIELSEIRSRLTELLTMKDQDFVKSFVQDIILGHKDLFSNFLEKE